MAAALGVAGERLLIPYQVHSADALIVHEPWPEGERPRCDGIVTNMQGLALGVTGADCGVLLFSDARAGVIGAAHAGWKGALTGVIEATVRQMETFGAQRADIAVALGPTIGRNSYEVGPEFVARFTAEALRTCPFLRTIGARRSFLFRSSGLHRECERDEANVGTFENLALDTYADEARFYSYRRMTHRGERITGGWLRRSC